MDKLATKEIDEAKKFTTTEVEEAERFGNFLIDLLNNHRENLIFYLADTAVLDWFGRTIKGPRDIGVYLKSNTEIHTLNVSAIQPVQSIGFRDSHAIKYPSKTIGFNKASASSANGSNEVTPPQLKISDIAQTHVAEMGQGDGFQNNYEVPESPMKRCKLDDAQGDCTAEPLTKYLSAEGHMEFRKKSSKKLQGETKWSRPCKLEIAYCGNTFQDCTVYMMIYTGNMKCRRNLLKDFESCEPDD